MTRPPLSIVLNTRYCRTNYSTITWMKWMQSYLQCRSMFVVVGSAMSQMYSVRHGVPQGSVLGPLLYLLYTNEISESIKDDICTNRCHRDTNRLFGSECVECGIMTIYADDAQYMTAGTSRMGNQIRLEKCFDNIMDFLESNGLEMNQGKTSQSL